MTCHREWDLTPKLYIGNLEPHEGETEVREIFSRYGTIKDIRMSGDEVVPGFAFIEFETEHQTMLAARALDGLVGKVSGDRDRGRLVLDKTRKVANVSDHPVVSFFRSRRTNLGNLAPTALVDPT
jgi:RNA recognition motif-containing protein